VNDDALLDRCLKVLFRHVYPVLLRMLNARVDPARVRPIEVTVALAERRLDSCFEVGREGEADAWILAVEYQLRPDARLLPSWYYKNAAVALQLRRPVITVVMYLERGDRATFPDRYVAEGGGLRNTFHFVAVRLWEYAERIASGELAELAPLLVLAERQPTEATLERERELIQTLPLTDHARAELTAVALMAARRFFSPEVLSRVFAEEREMLKELPFVQEWLRESEAEGEARGIAVGEARGIAVGELRGAQELLRTVLEERFGPLDAATAARLTELDAQRCREVTRLAVRAASLAELPL
jgi:predicted transposase YdaD